MDITINQSDHLPGGFKGVFFKEKLNLWNLIDNKSANVDEAPV